MTVFYDELGNYKPLSIIAGPCVFENLHHAEMMSSALRDICNEVGNKYYGYGKSLNFIYKTSFDKANRTSASSYRGTGFDDAYYAFQSLRANGTELLTDIHESWQCDTVQADVIQIPAFLCRQTDLLHAAADSGKVINVKKGQFLSPQEMLQVIKKLEHFGAKKIIVTERGTTFGYNNLVVDMRSLEIMRSAGYPVVMDCTHAAQAPGGLGGRSGGDREMAKVIARAAVGVGVAGVFMEVHQDPDNAPSDGPNMIRLDQAKDLITELIELDLVRKRFLH